MTKQVKHKFIVPVTFISVGTPTAQDTTGHKLKRKFVATVTFVEAYENTPSVFQHIERCGFARAGVIA